MISVRRIALLAVLSSAVLGSVSLFVLNRKSPEEQFRDGLAALRAGEIESVERAIRQLRTQPGFSSHVRLLRAGCLSRSGEYDLALRELALLRPEGVVRAPACLLASECFYRQGRLVDAERIARELLRENPEHADGHRWLASIYYDIGATYAAMDELRHVIRLDPGDFAPRRLLGLIYFDFENYREAIRCYRESLQRDPPQEQAREIRIELAEALVKEHEYEPALKALEGVALGARELALKAECCFSLGRNQLAEEALRLAQERDPDERSVLLLRARMQMESNRPEAAVDLLERVLRRDPHDFECRYQLALAFRRMGRTGDYEREMAAMLASRELVRRLSELNTKAMEIPHNPEIREELSQVCERLGKPELAKIWRRAAEACRARRDTFPSG